MNRLKLDVTVKNRKPRKCNRSGWRYVQLSHSEIDCAQIIADVWGHNGLSHIISGACGDGLRERLERLARDMGVTPEKLANMSRAERRKIGERDFKIYREIPGYPYPKEWN